MPPALSRPSIQAMPERLRSATVAVAERLGKAGFRVWLVGGAVRDLALEIEPHDADLATAALPDEVEGVFGSTREVGKRFGTILVLEHGAAIQVTTFRSEGVYSDARRPDEVMYGKTLEEDAARRDFTCNALYLDPLTDELVDPEGGFKDLEAGLLRCVGDPLRRFGEDGLRLLRLARFAARYGLEVEEHTLSAARASAAALDGVSRERVRDELAGMAVGPDPARALALLAEVGIWEHFLPVPASGCAARVAAVARLGPAPGLAPVLAVLLSGEPGALHGLRLSRNEEREVQNLWELGAALENLESGEARRSERIRLVRSPAWPAALEVYRALHVEADAAALDELEAFGQHLGPEEREPRPWITSSDLEELGIERGPRWSRLLREAEDLQLDGTHASRADALAWLRAARDS